MNKTLAFIVASTFTMMGCNSCTPPPQVPVLKGGFHQQQYYEQKDKIVIYKHEDVDSIVHYRSVKQGVKHDEYTTISPNAGTE